MAILQYRALSSRTVAALTNTFFEGAAAAQPKAERGHSKEKRGDCPLLTLGLVLDGSGFVRRSEVFSGAVNEDKTLASMLEALGAPSDALVVMDAGIATEANIAWLRENGYRYLAVSRERTRRFDPDLALAIETRSHQTVHVHKAVDAEGGEARLYCYSEARAKKEQGIANRFAARFEGEMSKLNDGLKRPRTRKRLDHVWQRIGRIREKSRGAAAHYDIDVIADDSGEKARAVTWERRPLAGTMITHPGVYCLRTNVQDWDEETLWRTYTSLTDVEAVFRSLKSELGLRPIFHRTQGRSDGHLFITVIAYQMVQTIRRRLGEKGERESWASLRAILEGQQRVGHELVRRPVEPLGLAVEHVDEAPEQALALVGELEPVRPDALAEDAEGFEHRVGRVVGVPHLAGVELVPLGCRAVEGRVLADGGGDGLRGGLDVLDDGHDDLPI